LQYIFQESLGLVSVGEGFLIFGCVTFFFTPPAFGFFPFAPGFFDSKL